MSQNAQHMKGNPHNKDQWLLTSQSFQQNKLHRPNAAPRVYMN